MALTKIKTSGIADNAITNAKMADNAIDSVDLAAGSIDNAHLAGSIAVSKTLLSAGAGLTLSTNSLAVDADQSGQITSVGTLTGLTTSGNLIINHDGANSLRIGATADLQFHHDGTDSVVSNGQGGSNNGKLYLWNYGSGNTVIGSNNVESIVCDGANAIFRGTGTFAGDVTITGGSTTALTIGDTTGDTFQKMVSASASGIQLQLWHGSTQTATINSNTTNIFSVYDGSAGATNVFNIADGGDATFSGGVDIIKNSGGGHPIIKFVNHVNDGEACTVQFRKSRNTTIGSHTVVQDNDELGNLTWYASDGNSWERSAAIKCFVDGAPGDGDVPARLEFQTTADGASAPATKMTIAQDGGVGIGTTEPLGGRFHVQGKEFLMRSPGGTNQFYVWGVDANENNCGVSIYQDDGTQTINLHTDGNTYFNGGNVGIGQATPQTDNSTARFLHIGSSSDATSGLVIEDNETQWELQVNGSLNFLSGTTNMLGIRADNGNAMFGGNIICNEADGQLILANGSEVTRAYLQYQESADRLVISTNEAGSDMLFLPAGNTALTLTAELTATFAGDIKLNANGTKYITGNSNSFVSDHGNGYLFLQTNSNEMLWGSHNSTTIYIIYRAAANSTVTHYEWNAGTSSSYATHNASAWNTSSDISLKKDIESIPYGLDTIKLLEPKKYKLKQDDSENLGLIAQDVEGVIDEIISTNEKNELKGINYTQLIPVLIKSVQELSDKLDTANAKITALEGN